MKREQTHNELQPPLPAPQQSSLGWSPFFQEQITRLNTDHLAARIVGVRKNIYLAKQENKEEQLVTLAGRLHNDPQEPRPVVGDWVLLRDSMITSVLNRKNTLARRASGGRTGKEGEPIAADQVIAANLDLVFIVCGLDRDYNPRRIERYLTLVYNCGITPVILLTKSDLHQDPQSCIHEVESIAYGVPVHAVCPEDEPALQQIASLLTAGVTAALVGSSGAGKSTLINLLSQSQIQFTAAVSTRLGKGRHTTTTRDLFILPSGGMVIDNPGIREIGLSMAAQNTSDSFPDIDELARFCRFADCSHTHEPGCRVQEAAASGKLSAKRLRNYQKLRNELAYASERQNKDASRIEKERWKAVSQKAKSIKKHRQQYTD